MAVTTAERSSSGEKSSRPMALTPSRQARPRRRERSHAASRPSARSRSSETSRPRTSETAGVNGVRASACDFSARCQSSVEARRGRRLRDRVERPRRGGANASPGGVISAFCEPDDDDVDAPGVRLERDRTERRDGVDDGERRRVAGRERDRLHVGDDPRRGLALRAVDDADAAELGQRPDDVGRVGRLSPGVAQMRDLAPVGGRGSAPSARRSSPQRRRAPGRPARRGWRPRTPSPRCRDESGARPRSPSERRPSAARARATRTSWNSARGGRRSAPPSPLRPPAGSASARESSDNRVEASRVPA